MSEFRKLAEMENGQPVAAGTVFTRNAEPIPNAELAAFREVVNQATPGPWKNIKPGHGQPSKYRCVQLGKDDSYTTLEMEPDDAKFIAQSREMCVRLLDEVERLKTWGGLMSTLAEFYPEAVFDGSSGDPGAMIVALTRDVDRLRAENERLAGAYDDCVNECTDRVSVAREARDAAESAAKESVQEEMAKLRAELARERAKVLQLQQEQMALMSQDAVATRNLTQGE